MNDTCSLANRSGEHSNMTFDSVINVQDIGECKLTPGNSDIYLKPCLASQKLFLEGNKTKSGLWRG